MRQLVSQAGRQAFADSPTPLLHAPHTTPPQTHAASRSITTQQPATNRIPHSHFFCTPAAPPNDAPEEAAGRACQGCCTPLEPEPGALGLGLGLAVTVVQPSDMDFCLGGGVEVVCVGGCGEGGGV